VVVREVIPGSLADDWGVRKGDIIVGFADRQKQISCALDFEGYRVTTGKMKTWPPEETPAAARTVAAQSAAQAPTTETLETEPAKLHLAEMVLCTDEGDDVALWYVRRGAQGYQRIDKKLQYKEPVPMAHLGTFEKPPFELWGDFVAQDFNDYATPLFEIPQAEVLKGGALVTFVEPNSLASRRGMDPANRPSLGFSFMFEYAPRTTWVIIETVNDKPVKNLTELKSALREAEQVFEGKKKAPGYDPARRILMKENYVQIGFRTNTTDGTVLHLEPAFPIDEALECRKNVNLTPGQPQ